MFLELEHICLVAVLLMEEHCMVMVHELLVVAWVLARSYHPVAVVARTGFEL